MEKPYTKVKHLGSDDSGIHFQPSCRTLAFRGPENLKLPYNLDANQGNVEILSEVRARSDTVAAFRRIH